MDSTANEDSHAALRMPLVGEAARKEFLSLFSECYYPADKITVTDRLGSGTYAKVYKAMLDDGTKQRLVAVKKMEPARFQEEQDVLDFFRETELLASARNAGHPNILAFIGVTFAALEEDSEASMCILEECMDHGTLKLHIERARSHEEDIPVETFLEWVMQVARGLSFLHVSSVSVIHRDLKPANILIDKDEESGELTAKLADFGLSVLVFDRRVNNPTTTPRGVTQRREGRERTFVRSISSLTEYADAFVLSRRASKLRGRGSGNLIQRRASGLKQEFYSLTGQTGSLAYMAPEVYKKREYNHKADVFSFGVLAFEALDLVHPFIYYVIENKQMARLIKGAEEEMMEDYAQAVAEGYRPQFGSKWRPSFISLISSCWAQDPNDRPNMAEVVQRLEGICEQCTSEDVFYSAKRRLCGCFSA